MQQKLVIASDHLTQLHHHKAVQCQIKEWTRIIFQDSNDLNRAKSCQSVCHRDVTVRKLVGSSPRLLFTHRSWQSSHHCHPSWYRVELGHFAIVCLPLVPYKAILAYHSHSLVQKMKYSHFKLLIFGEYVFPY